MTSIFN